MKKNVFLISIILIMAMISCSIKGNGNKSNINGGNDGVGPSIVECNDGIDNDGDGLTDWQYDTGCAHKLDNSERAAARCQEDGFSVFDPGDDSNIIYVSSLIGSDMNNGTSPQQAVKTLSHAAALVRDEHNDFILLRRGDTWRGENLGAFKSGLNKTHPIVISSYGESKERPRIEVDRYFIDHNGQERNFVTVTGLQIVPYHKIPNDPAFDGTTGGAFRYVGGGNGLLIEDCHILYGEVILQSYGGYHYKDVEIRRNIIEYSYHVNTCGQNPTYRPSGLYASHVKDLLIEGNIFDHNGWNEKVSSACASMYNHNMYLNANNLTVRDNIISRASSMGIKMRSDATGDANGLLFENNLLVDGEIGISIGGNTSEPYRFNRVTIRRNVFSQIGMSNPTGRDFAWMLDVQDNNNTIIEKNYFLHQPWYTNAYGIRLRGNSGSNIEIIGNTFYDLKQRSIYVNIVESWNNILISENIMADPGHNSCLIDHNGSFNGIIYKNNHYFNGTGAECFFVNSSKQTLRQWETVSGETGAVLWTGAFPDPGRTVGGYAATLGIRNTLEDFITSVKKQSRLNWRKELTAEAVNDYIRAGFN